MVYDDLELVGEAADGEQALLFLDRARPDVVLMDLKMPRLDGI
jgi:NarL family two-component system response regulator LiaR